MRQNSNILERVNESISEWVKMDCDINSVGKSFSKRASEWDLDLKQTSYKLSEWVGFEIWKIVSEWVSGIEILKKSWYKFSELVSGTNVWKRIDINAVSKLVGLTF